MLDDKPPSITVLIAAYNAAPFLARAVHSALDQTLSPTEILIVDDASTDTTFDVANSLACSDSRIRVFRLPVNSGPAAARNAGLAVATGDWVAILDADDAFLPDRLRGLMACRMREEADILLGNFFFFDAKMNEAGDIALDRSEEIRRIDIYVYLEHARPYSKGVDWGLKPVFRRRFLIDNGLRYPEFCRHGEDFLLMFRALRANALCVLLHVPGYLYSTRDSGMSRTKVDYEAMIEHTNALLNDTTLASDAMACALLRRRALDLTRWSLEHKLNTARDAGDFSKVAYLVVTHPSIFFRLFRYITRETVKWMSDVWPSAH